MNSPEATFPDSTTTTDLHAVVSAKPIVLPGGDGGEDLQLRVSAPATGSDLPVVVFSHGFGESMNGYGPLADHWAAHGFVVVQPTHLDSQSLALPPTDPRTPLIWRFRIEDLVRAIDGLAEIEKAVPGLAGRVDRDRLAVAGHSWGAGSASALLGARVLDDEGQVGEDFADRRVKAGVLLSIAGSGGADLTPFAAESFPFMNPEFAGMAPPALIVAGDEDHSPLTTRGPDWFADAFELSPGEKTLVVVSGAEHLPGGIDKYEVAHPGEELDPKRADQLRLVQRLTTAYLRSALGVDDSSWTAATQEAASDDIVTRVESR